MAGEISYFRKRFLGGFNREDVIDYIEKLAQERNKLQAEKTAAEQRLMQLSGELETLRHEIEEARRTEFEDRENKIAAVIAALRTFADLETTLSDLSQDVFKISERAREEFGAARKNIAELPTILEQADRRFAEILTVFGDASADDSTADSAAGPAGATYSAEPAGTTTYAAGPAGAAYSAEPATYTAEPAGAAYSAEPATYTADAAYTPEQTVNPQE